MPEFQIPKRVSLEDLKSILKGYYVEGAHNDPISSKAVENTTQLSDRVGRQTPFLVEIGLIEKKGRERLLTDAGAEIAEALMGGGEAIAKSEMRNVLMEWEFTKKVTGFVRMQGPVEESQLHEYLKANAASDDTRGKETLLELYLWTDVLKKSEEGMYDVADSKHPSTTEQPTSDGDETTKEPEEVSRGRPSESTLVQPTDSTTGGINVDFNFSAKDDPKDILGVIVAARRGLRGDLTELVTELDEDDVEP